MTVVEIEAMQLAVARMVRSSCDPWTVCGPECSSPTGLAHAALAALIKTLQLSRHPWPLGNGPEEPSRRHSKEPGDPDGGGVCFASAFMAR